MYIRMAEERDLQTLADIRYRARTVSYRGYVNDAYLDSLSYASMLDKSYQFFTALQQWHSTRRVALDDQHIICGFLIGRLSAEIQNVTHELDKLYVDPACQGQGIGKALVDDFKHVVSQQNGTWFFVWAFRDRPIARIFYEKRGSILSSETNTIQLGEVVYPLVCYKRSSRTILGDVYI